MPIAAFSHDDYFSSVFAWPKAGRRLQPIKAPQLLDHSSLRVFVRVKTCVMHRPKDHQIDRNLPTRCVLRGEKRYELLDNVRKRCDEFKELRYKSIEHRSAAIMYHIIVTSLRKAAVDTFPKQKRANDAQHKKLLK